MSVESPELTNNLVKEGKRAEQPRSGEASAQPQEAEPKTKRVINLESVLLGPDGIHIRYTWVQGGKPNVSYTLPLGKVQEMVQRGVCIFSEGFDDSQGSTVEENWNKLLEFVQKQENLRREREWDLLAKTASELSFPDSKNPTKVADEPNVSTRPETDIVAAQTPEQEPDSDRIEAQQTDSSEQKPDSGRIEARINTGDQSSEAFTSPETDTVAAQTPEQEPDSDSIEAQQTDSSEQEPDSDKIEAQQTDSSEQEPDSGERFKSRINETLIAGLENENCYEGLNSIERFLTSGEFEISSVSPEYIQLIANAILTIVDQGIQSQGLQFVNRFLRESRACLDILNRAIDNTESTQTPEQLKEEVEKLNKAIGMESIQIAEQLKERLTKLFIRIRDQVVGFNDLVEKTKDKSFFHHTLSEIIGQDKLHFLKLIYLKITQGRSQVDRIIQQVFAGPFGAWVKANIIRINAIAGLEQAYVNRITQDLERLKQLKKRSSETGLKFSKRELDEYNSIKSRYNIRLKEALLDKQSKLFRYKEDLSSNGPGVNEILIESDNILRRIRSLINDVDQIINLRIPIYL